MNCATQTQDKQGLKNPGKNYSWAVLQRSSISQQENGFLVTPLEFLFLFLKQELFCLNVGVFNMDLNFQYGFKRVFLRMT